MSNLIDHPAHYKSGGIEVIDVIEAFDLNFARGSVVKYVCRAGRKDDEKEVVDLRKAAWYATREANRLEGKVPVLADPPKTSVQEDALDVQERVGGFRVLEVSVQFPCSHVGTFYREDFLKETVTCYVCKRMRQVSEALSGEGKGIA